YRSSSWSSVYGSLNLLDSKPASRSASLHLAQCLPSQSFSPMPVSVRNLRQPGGIPPFAAALRLISSTIWSLVSGMGSSYQTGQIRAKYHGKKPFSRKNPQTFTEGDAAEVLKAIDRGMDWLGKSKESKAD